MQHPAMNGSILLLLQDCLLLTIKLKIYVYQFHPVKSKWSSLTWNAPYLKLIVFTGSVIKSEKKEHLQVANNNVNASANDPSLKSKTVHTHLKNIGYLRCILFC